MSGDGRLPARVEIGALMRLVESAGGFGAVLHSGDDTAGAIVLVLTEKGINPRTYERMPQADGARAWHRVRQDLAEAAMLQAYLDRRKQQDPDLWIVELDVAGGEQLIGLPKFAD
jgi:hypothetical protein